MTNPNPDTFTEPLWDSLARMADDGWTPAVALWQLRKAIETLQGHAATLADIGDAFERAGQQVAALHATEPDAGAVLILAEIIRKGDGGHGKGAAALAEAILSHPRIAEVLPPRPPAHRKPPLGVRPRWLAWEHRRAELRAAIERYEAAGLPVPQSWKEELLDLGPAVAAPPDLRVPKSPGYLHIEALPNGEKWLHVALPNGKRAAYNLGTQPSNHFGKVLEAAAELGKTQWSAPATRPKSTRSLVEVVIEAISTVATSSAKPGALRKAQARAAIAAVAEWLEHNHTGRIANGSQFADLLRETL
jgi:hypothetical protein